MTTETFSLSIREYELKGRWFLPTGKVLGTAHLIHGQGDYSERYEEILHIFTDKGIAVCAVDFPGHGESMGKRGDIPSLEFIDEFMTTVKGIINKRYPEALRGLMGHSMGGMLAIRELLYNPTQYSFSWLSSPLIRPTRTKSSLQISLLLFLGKYFPTLTVDTGVKRVLCRRVPKKNGTSSEENLNFHKRISLRWGGTLIELERFLMRAESISALKSIQTSTLITQGTADKVTPAECAEEFVRERGWERLEISYIKEALHEPFRDTVKQDFFTVMDEWVKKVLEEATFPS